MRLVERHRDPFEAHYTEGELDLEPPEELAVGELDDEAILEEELDNEDLLEQDVEEDTLEASLEVLVHGGDNDDEADEATADPIGPKAVDGDDVEDAALGGEDFEDSLDLVLLDRLALLDDGEEDGDQDAGSDLENGVVVPSLRLQMQIDNVELVDVAPRRSDEFVCRSCFLVRKRVQLADAVAMACHDCAT